MGYSYLNSMNLPQSKNYRYPPHQQVEKTSQGLNLSEVVGYVGLGSAIGVGSVFAAGRLGLINKSGLKLLVGEKSLIEKTRELVGKESQELLSQVQNLTKEKTSLETQVRDLTTELGTIKRQVKESSEPAPPQNPHRMPPSSQEAQPSKPAKVIIEESSDTGDFSTEKALTQSDSFSPPVSKSNPRIIEDKAPIDVQKLVQEQSRNLGEQKFRQLLSGKYDRGSVTRVIFDEKTMNDRWCGKPDTQIVVKMKNSQSSLHYRIDNKSGYLLVEDNTTKLHRDKTPYLAFLYEGLELPIDELGNIATSMIDQNWAKPFYELYEVLALPKFEIKNGEYILQHKGIVRKKKVES